MKKSPGRKSQREQDHRDKEYHRPYRPPVLVTASAMAKGRTLNPKLAKKKRKSS